MTLKQVLAIHRFEQLELVVKLVSLLAVVYIYDFDGDGLISRFINGFADDTSVAGAEDVPVLEV